MKKLNLIFIFLITLSFFVFILCTGSESRDESTQNSNEASAEDRQIVEPDIYSIDDDTLYIANLYKGLVAVDITEKEKPELIGSMQLKGSPKEMYFRDNVTIMLLNPSYYYNYYYQYYYGIDTNDHSLVSFIDTTDKSNMEFITEFMIPGYMVDSRVVGDILYVVTNVYEYSGNYNNYYSYYRNIRRTNYITSINLNTFEKISTITIEGSSSAIHVTKEAIFISSMDSDYWNTNKSTITRYDISDPNGNVTLNSSIDIVGTIPDRFKLNYYHDYLRVVSYDWNQTVTKVHSIYWGDKKEPILENTLSLAIGESLFATRFSGDIGYVVTFLRKDPLFIIDFTEPSNPIIAAAMDDIPGWSDHIEVIGDRLFALGQENGRGKVAYFDVSDPYRPVLLQTIFLGDNSYYSYSTASWDYKRLNYIPAFDAFAVPVNTYSNAYYKTYVELIKINRDSIESFAILEHIGNVKRTIQISDEILYTYSDDKIHSHHVDSEGNVQAKSELVLTENVFYLIKLNEEIGIKFVNRYFYQYGYYYIQNPIIKTFNNKLDIEDNDYLGKLVLEVNVNKYIYYDEHIIINDVLYILRSTGGPYYGYAEPSLLMIDFKDPAKPKFLGEYNIPGNYTYKYNSLYYNSHRQNTDETVFHQIDQNTLAVSINSNLVILDISDGGIPALLSQVFMNDKKYSIHRAFYNDDLVYLFSVEENFFNRFNDKEYDYYTTVYDISNPQKPEELYTKQLTGMPIAFLEDNYIVCKDMYQTLFGGNSYSIVVEEITQEKTKIIYRKNLGDKYINYHIYDKDYMFMISSKYSYNKYHSSLTYSYIDENLNYKEDTVITVTDGKALSRLFKHENKLYVFTNKYSIIILEEIEKGKFEKIDEINTMVNYSYGAEIIGDILYQWAGIFGLIQTKID